jgi:small-conductance mechanosensitive channel
MILKMANSKYLDGISMSMASLVKWFQKNLLTPVVFIEVGAIGVSYLIAWFFAAKVRQHLEKDIERVKVHMRFVLSPAHFAIVLKYVFWLVLVWFFQVLFKNLKMPTELLRTTLTLVLALLVIRFVSLYIKSAFWSRFLYVLSIIFLSLRIFKLWSPTVELLESMKIDIGSISISLWGLLEAIAVFVMLWVVAGTANRFIAHWLATSSHLTYSDRTLIQRVVAAVTGAMVILISLKAAGVHMAAIAVTGGAIGFAVGIGLQKIGSNMVSGLILLLRKPIRQGDVVAVAESSAGAIWGWITGIGLMYVTVATRDGVLHLIPNETFVTQKIENLSFEDDLVRLHIPFGISYASDLKKAITLAVAAAMSIDRVLKNPQPKCFTREFGDSTVNFELLVWINDPKNGFGNVKDAVLLAVWDSFHANGIEIAFPQRDLHIKSAVPLQISRDNLHPVEKDSLEATFDRGKLPE